MTPKKQLKRVGTLSRKYPFDLEKFKQAIKQLKSQDEKFGVDLKGDNFPKNYYDLFVHEPAFDFELLRISRLAIEEKRENVKITGDVICEEFGQKHLFIHGDLHIEGNLVFDAGLFVTGNLVVNGIIQDFMEWTPLLVGGDIVAKGMDVGGQFYCAGSVKTDCLCIGGTGKLHTRNGLTAKLLIEQGYEYEIEGDINVETRIDFRKDDKPENGIQVLRKVLREEVFEPIEKEWEGQGKGDDFYFSKELVMDVIMKGNDILKAQSEKAKF